MKAIIWDFNGTLLDDTPVWYKAFCDVLTKYDLTQITLEEYKNIYQHPVQKMFELVGYSFNNCEGLHLFEELNTSYKKYKVEIKLFDDAIESLQFIKNKNIQQFILSALHEPILKKYLDFFKINDFFNLVSGASDTHGKSKINAGIELLELININPDEILLIGDSTHDFETAKALNVNCILVSRGSESKERLIKNTVPVFDNFNEVRNYIFKRYDYTFP